MNSIVYGLIDPNTRELRYIGVTCNLQRRIKEHHKKQKLSKITHKNNWIKSLINNNQYAEVCIIEVHSTYTEALTAESDLIFYYRFIGCNLTNMTNGGEGTVGYKMSEELRCKLSNIAKQRPVDLSKINKMVESNKNKRRILSNEHKGKISAAKKGRKTSEDTKIKLSIAAKRKTPEQIRVEAEKRKIQFSDLQIADIVFKSNNGVSIRKIAKEYKCSLTPIRRVLGK